MIANRYSKQTHMRSNLTRSLLLLPFCMAIYRQVRSPVVHRPRFCRLQHRRHPAALLLPRSSHLVCRSSHLRYWRGYRHRHHPHVLRRDGPQGNPWSSWQLLPVLLYPRCLLQLLGRLCRLRTHGSDKRPVAGARGTTACSGWYPRIGYALDKGKYAMACEEGST